MSWVHSTYAILSTSIFFAWTFSTLACLLRCLEVSLARSLIEPSHSLCAGICDMASGLYNVLLVFYLRIRSRSVLILDMLYYYISAHPCFGWWSLVHTVDSFMHLLFLLQGEHGLRIGKYMSQQKIMNLILIFLSMRASLFKMIFNTEFQGGCVLPRLGDMSFYSTSHMSRV